VGWGGHEQGAHAQGKFFFGKNKRVLATRGQEGVFVNFSQEEKNERFPPLNVRMRSYEGDVNENAG
jgi:hypothetical protein